MGHFGLGGELWSLSITGQMYLLRFAPEPGTRKVSPVPGKGGVILLLIMKKGNLKTKRQRRHLIPKDTALPRIFLLRFR